MTEKIAKTIEALKKNRMDAYYAEKKEDVLPIIKSLIKKGDKIGAGGSVTLKQIDTLSLFKNGDYNFIDRYEPGITDEERTNRFREAFFADVFVMSSNAVTTSGRLINVDGFGNRVAALVFGPKSVIVVVGANKIVETTEEGFRRIRKIAAPKNTKRLNCKTYCESCGECMGDGDIGSGCSADQRICCHYVVSSFQRDKGRIKVIVCEEELGY